MASWCGFRVVPAETSEPLCLAEGPETGLSVWIATGYATHIALGGMVNHEPPTGQPVVACRDDDPPQSPADKGLFRALAVWRQAGADVRVATPWAERRGDRSDFNDVLQAGGTWAVKARIELAINPEPAGGRTVRLSVAEARRDLAKAVAGFFSAAEVFDMRRATALETARGRGRD